MNNYEYIIASLPVLEQDARHVESLDVGEITGQIKEHCSDKDRALIDLLLKGFDSESLTEDFYREALGSHNPFISKYFDYDLMLRDTKTEYLNRALGRPAVQDCITLDEDKEFDPQDVAEVKAVLERTDILERERGLDDLLWNRSELLTQLHVFDIDVILGFLTRLQTIARWLRLDPQSGRELFRKLVEEIRNSK